MYRIHHCFIIVNDRSRTRTCNLRIRSPTPYPLGHTTTAGNRNHERSFLITFNSNGSCFWYIQPFQYQWSYGLDGKAPAVSRRSQVRVSLGPIIDVYNYEIKFCLLFRNMFTIQTTLTTLFSVFSKPGLKMFAHKQGEKHVFFSQSKFVPNIMALKSSYFDLQRWTAKNWEATSLFTLMK